MENFDSNEQMYIKVANGEAYDILVPSDYMIQRLIEEDYLQKLDKSKLDCLTSCPMRYLVSRTIRTMTIPFRTSGVP